MGSYLIFISLFGQNKETFMYLYHVEMAKGVLKVHHMIFGTWMQPFLSFPIR